MTNDSLTNLTVDETFDTASTFLSFDVDGAGNTLNVQSAQTGISGTNTIAYDDAADSFTLSVSQGGVTLNQTFLPADIDATRSDDSFRVYSIHHGSGDITDFLLLIPGEPLLDLSYVTLGVWSSSTADPTREATLSSVVFGVQTPDTDMPTSGQGVYAGLTVGQLDASNNAFSLSGMFQVDVDFANGAVNGVFTNMMKQNSVTGVVSTWRDFGATGSITSGTNLFSGTATTNDTLLTGTLDGGFFGPATPVPAETGGNWSLSGAGETAVGSFVGKR